MTTTITPTTPTMTLADMQAEMAKLRAELALAKAAKTHKLSLKISEKGGLSVYGLGRFPVTLYKEQWVRLIAIIEDVKKFIADNDSKLSVKQ